jgi:hypothetical protein
MDPVSSIEVGWFEEPQIVIIFEENILELGGFGRFVLLHIFGLRFPIVVVDFSRWNADILFF